MNIRFGILFVGLPGILAAQAMVETGLGASRAATAAAPARKAGKAVGGAFDHLNRRLQNPENTRRAARSATTTPAGHPARTAARLKSSGVQTQPAVSFEDPSAIQEGMDVDEVVNRFGMPSLKLTTSPGEETLCYRKKGLSVDATVRDGKVAVVQKTGGIDEPAAPAGK